MVAGGGFRRRSFSGDVKHLGRKGLIFLVILMLFFLLQLHNTIFSTPLSSFQFGRQLGVVFPAGCFVFPAAEGGERLVVVFFYVFEVLTPFQG